MRRSPTRELHIWLEQTFYDLVETSVSRAWLDGIAMIDSNDQLIQGKDGLEVVLGMSTNLRIAKVPRGPKRVTDSAECPPRLVRRGHLSAEQVKQGEVSCRS
jgi:hypothetical protein